MRRPRSLAGSLAGLLGGALLAAMSLAGCGDTLQDKPIAPQAFESVIVKSRFPVYWVGLRFSGLSVTGVSTDPGGAVTIQYGDCIVGGQYTCVTPLSIVTSPDNSFVPGGSGYVVGASSGRLSESSAVPLESSAVPSGGTRSMGMRVRGVRASSRAGGTVVSLVTGGVAVSVYARTAALAKEAAQTMIPLNESVIPATPLPKPRPDTGVQDRPLPSQLPAGA